MTDERAAQWQKICDHTDSCPGQVISLQDLRALLAAREEAKRLREAVTGKIGAWMSIQEALAFIGEGRGDRGDTLTEWAKDYSDRLDEALTGEAKP